MVLLVQQRSGCRGPEVQRVAHQIVVCYVPMGRVELMEVWSFRVSVLS